MSEAAEKRNAYTNAERQMSASMQGRIERAEPLKPQPYMTVRQIMEASPETLPPDILRIRDMTQELLDQIEGQVMSIDDGRGSTYKD